MLSCGESSRLRGFTPCIFGDHSVQSNVIQCHRPGDSTSSSQGQRRLHWSAPRRDDDLRVLRNSRAVIRDFHSVFVTTVHLALEFESKRKRDDNFSVSVRVPDGDIIYGFLGLFDRTANIAVTTAFNLNTGYVYHVDTSVRVGLQQGTGARTLVAVGCAFDGTLMRSECF
ncbi:hypothetical protein D1007_41473 [Hordeum vulgare]|nr:hypothetical protein D1007_41473 [Hordeum vulgare]